MSWGILFILVAVAMAVGPIMMFKPSAHTRRLEALRTQATQLGLKLRTTSYESRNKHQSVIVYSYLCKTPFTASILLRNDVPHDIHFYQQWDWQDGKSAELSQSQSQNLVRFLEKLPDTIVGVEFSVESVGLWWQEKNTGQWGVNELKASLIELKTLLFNEH